MPPVLIEREIEIERPPDEVFAFVADPLNDPRWCPKVRSVEGGPDRYTVVHAPVPLRPARTMEMTRVAADPPRRLVFRQDDGHDTFEVTYELEPTTAGTLFRQRSDAEVGVPRFLRPLWRHGIGRDLARQLRELKRVLETGNHPVSATGQRAD
jgi:uncharacterized protein YndB with AHSA1/START domain